MSIICIKKAQKTIYRAGAERRGSTYPVEEINHRVFRPSRELVNISRVLTSPTTPKKDRYKTCLFLAQKTRFELVLRFPILLP